MAQSTPGKDLVSEMEGLRTEAVPAKSSMEALWDRCWDLYNGDQWKTAEFPIDWTRDERVTVNLLKSTINTVSPIEGDALPTWYVKAYDPRDDEKADLLTRFMQGIWYDERLDRVYTLVRKDAHVTGTGAMKVFLNTTARRGATPTAPPSARGRIDVCHLDPYSLYPDPNAQNLEDARYLLIRSVLPASLVKRLYPKADLDRMETENTSERRGQYYESTTDSGEEKRFQVWETYHDFGEKLTVWSGSEVLWSGDSPVPGGRFPVVLFLDDERGQDMWGSGMIANGGDEIQTAVNRCLWRVMCHARVCVNPRLIKTGVGTVVMRNAPGDLVEVNSPTARLEPLRTPDLPPYIFQALQLLLYLWDTMTGVHDVTSGQRPKGIQSGAAIMRLQEAAQTRIRQTIREWSLSLGDVGQIVLDMMQAYYTGVQTVFRMTSDGPQRVSFVAEEVLRDPVGGPIPYRVVVQPQNDLPMSQVDWAQLVMQLAAIPWPDPALQKMVFSLLRIPGREEYFATRQQLALESVQQVYKSELEAGLSGRADIEGAMSPEPVSPDTSNMDFLTAMALQSGIGQEDREDAVPL